MTVTLAGRRIELWVEPRAGQPALNPVMRALLDRLTDDGAVVAVRVPEWRPRPLVEDVELGRRPARVADLVLLKTATSLALAIASGMQSAGGRFLNGASASMRAADKAATLAWLAAARLPVPATWLWPPRAESAPTAPLEPASTLGAGLESRSEGWVTKPVQGIHGTGVQSHADRDSAMAALGGHQLMAGRTAGDASFVLDDGCRLLQARVGDGDDIKVYVAGDAVFAGRKAFTASSFTSDRVDPLKPDRRIIELALLTARVLGLRIFGLDLRDGPGGPWIVDVNAFPGYRGFPDAVEPLRAEVLAAVGRRDTRANRARA